LFPYHHNFLDKNSDDMAEYIDLEKKDNYFKLHSRLIQTDYVNKINNYSFGSQILPFFHFENLKYSHYLVEPVVGMPSRIFDYISAELPVIFDESFVEPNELISQYSIGINLKRGDLFRLNDLIDHNEHKKFKLNIIELKNRLIIKEKDILKNLIGLYEEFRLKTRGDVFKEIVLSKRKNTINKLLGIFKR